LGKAFQPGPDEISGDVQSLGNSNSRTQGRQADAALVHELLYGLGIGSQHADLFSAVDKEDLMVAVKHHTLGFFTRSSNDRVVDFMAIEKNIAIAELYK
jgi:hypothetical protein